MQYLICISSSHASPKAVCSVLLCASAKILAGFPHEAKVQQRFVSQVNVVHGIMRKRKEF